MDGESARGRFDWLVELGGSAVPAAAIAFAAWKLSPLFAIAPGAAVTGACAAGFTLSFAVMRSVAPEPRRHGLAPFAVEPIEALPELLLDQRFEEPLLLEQRLVEDDALLLEDRLDEPGPASRVVRLFQPAPVPTAGELKCRIDRHLAGDRGTGEPRPAPPADASDALYAALAELRRSLR